MSRWLLHYSPLAVIVRLCSLSILLSYACMQTFHLVGATYENVDNLSRALPVWIMMSISILVLYFSTQQDISVEEDKDDRRRQQILRTKCFYTIALTSLISLTAILTAVHLNELCDLLLDGNFLQRPAGYEWGSTFTWLSTVSDFCKRRT
jgi:N-glycosylation protein